MTVGEFAKSNGYIDTFLIGRWRGMRVYQAVYETENIESIADDTISVSGQNTGYPKFIIEDGGTYRMAEYDEAMEIIKGL